MKEDLIKLIRKGELQKALTKGEEFLKVMNDNYFLWTTLQSRFNDKKNQNTKGILSGEEYTKEFNLLNAQVLELILKIDSEIQENKNTSGVEETLKEKLQNSLLGSYEVLDMLSDGSLTTTFRAKELFDDDFVAIKTLKIDNHNSNGEVFEEINRVKNFNHRNLVSILGRSAVNASPKHVILEYIDGIPLNKIILENGSRPMGETKRILLKLCEALYYLHKRKVFNADLRASRVFIDKEGEPIFAPFILFRTKTDTNYDQIVSNLKYMSFQRLNSKDYKHFDPRSNQFSIGVLAYLLITGEPLFEGNSIVDLIEARNLFEKNDAYREEKLSKLDCSDDMKHLVKKLFAINRDDRYPSMFEIITDLRRMESFSNVNNFIAQESYSRACSFNPKITFELIKEINDRDFDSFPDLDINSFSKNIHNSISLIIETDSNKSYLMKAFQSIELSTLFLKYDKPFREVFYALLAESDYLWSEDIQFAWETTLNETFEEIKKTFATEPVAYVLEEEE